VTIISTTVSSEDTKAQFQRKIDRCQNGVLWSVLRAASSSALQFWFSTDDGATWTLDVTTISSGHSQAESAFFIDIDDYAHVTVYSGYWRGTPNAARTAWTWSSKVDLYWNNATPMSNTIVAHKEGTGWVAHIAHVIYSSAWFCGYRRIGISSSGVLTLGAFSLLGLADDTQQSLCTSIDFNHTGDGKTVANGTPNVYMAWNGDDGAGVGGYTVNYIEAVYSSGPTWTLGTRMALGNTVAHQNKMSMYFDGTRTCIAFVPASSNGQRLVAVWEVLPGGTSASGYKAPPEMNNNQRINIGAAYDSDQNIYIWADDNYRGNLYQTIFNRAANAWGAWTLVAAAAINSNTLSIKRDWSNNYIEAIWTNHNGANPTDVRYGNFGLNFRPSIPTILTPADNATVALTSGVDFTYTFGDPEGDLQVGYALKRRALTLDVGVVYAAQEWWNGTAWVGSEAEVASTTQPISISDWPAIGDTYQYALANSDASGLGPYSAWQTLNPYEWWDGTAWVPMVEGWIVSTTSEVTQSVVQADLEVSTSYNWTAATKDAAGATGPYAALFTFTAIGSFARIWNGSSWLDHEVFVRVSSNSWEQHSALIWDGSAWVNY